MSEEAQESVKIQAIQKAWDILTEHFDRVLLVTDYDEEGENGETQNAHQVWFHGGSLAAIGAAEYARDRLLKSGKSQEPDENAT